MKVLSNIYNTYFVKDYYSQTHFVFNGSVYKLKNFYGNVNKVAN